MAVVTIKFKIAKTKKKKRAFTYEQMIKAFRVLQDLGIIEVEYYDNREIEKEIKE